LLISIETDKTVVDVNSPVSGVLLKTVGQVDAEYDVGEVLAWIGDAGETVPDQPVEPDSKKRSVAAGPRITPVAQRLADRHGIDVDAVEGTGPDGRVTKEDVQRAIDDGTAPAKAEDTSAPAGEVVPLRGIRRITAERLSANWGVAPHVSEGIEVDFSQFESYRVEHEADWQEKWGTPLGPNDLILAATAQVLKDHPDLNTGFIDGAICRYHEVNLGVADNWHDQTGININRNAQINFVITANGTVNKPSIEVRVIL
jgi:pyruvate dehydrogenase E2 component (dihydrolipoamide acetyltransferase)